MYAHAAGVAGVGTLAWSSPAQAKIIYTPVHVNLSDNSYNLDLNHDGTIDFVLDQGVNCSTSKCISELLVSSCHCKQPNAIVGARRLPTALLPGVEIGPKQRFFNNSITGLMALAVARRNSSHTWTTTFQGPWANGGKGVKNRYLGLRFLINSKVHYGWARLNVGPNNAHGVLTGYAYETIPRRPIISGKTREPEKIAGQSASAVLGAPVREFATLGMLAVGAPGLSIWRREESRLASD